MATVPKPEDPKNQTPAASDQKSADASAETKPEETKAERLRRLRLELAAAEALNAGDDNEPPPPDKVLVLVNGTTVETSGAVPTHYSPEGWNYAPLRVVDVLALEA